MLIGTPCIYIYIYILGFHVVFSLCVRCKTKTKNFADFVNLDFQNFMKIKFSLRLIFFNFYHTGSCEVLKKFGPDKVSRFDVYWIQTNSWVFRGVTKARYKEKMLIVYTPWWELPRQKSYSLYFSHLPTLGRTY